MRRAERTYDFSEWSVVSASSCVVGTFYGGLGLSVLLFCWWGICCFHRWGTECVCESVLPFRGIVGGGGAHKGLR